MSKINKITVPLSRVIMGILMFISVNANALVPHSVSASANDGNSELNTIDHDLSTRWSAKGSDGSQWLQYYFSRQPNINAINIAFYKGDLRSAYFQIQSSKDGVNWALELEASGCAATTELETFVLDKNITDPFIRVIGFGNSSNAWNSISEVTFNEDIQKELSEYEIETVTPDAESSLVVSNDDVFEKH